MFDVESMINVLLDEPRNAANEDSLAYCGMYPDIPEECLTNKQKGAARAVLLRALLRILKIRGGIAWMDGSTTLSADGTYWL